MERAQYQVRGHLLEKLRTFHLTDQELVIEAADTPPIRIELATISEIRLRYAPTRVHTNRYECEIAAADKKYLFISMHFRGLLDFEDRGASYGAFCKALCARVALLNPALRCVGGHSPLRFYILVSLGSLMVLATIGLVVAFRDTVLARSLTWMRIVILVFLLGTLVQYFIGNRPRQFDPANLPDSALPKIV